MSFILVYQFIWGEVILIFLGVCYIIFHAGHGAWSKFWNFQEFKMFRKRQRSQILRKHTMEQKKVDSQMGRDSATGVVKKKISAKDKLELAAIVKSVQGKLAVQEYDSARAQIIEGIMLDRNSIELNVFLAQLYEKDHDYEKAEIIFRDLILQNDPKKADLYIHLGNNLVLQSKHGLAYDIFKKGLEKEPRNIALLETLSELGYELHEYEESLLYARKLTEIQSKHIRAHELLALSHLQVGSDQTAYDTFLALRKLDPYNEVVHVWLPRVEEKLGIKSTVL